MRLVRYQRRFFSSARHSGPARPHYDGRRFLNVEPTGSWSREVFRWLWSREPEGWPKWVEDAALPPPPSRVDGDELRATFINHSTVLIQTAGLNFVTDPVWSPRVGPFPWLGSPRVRAPGVSFDDLPKIDVILLSHDHYDHLDMASMRRLVERDSPRLFCGHGVERTLAIDGLTEAEPLDWWEGALVAPGVKVTFTPSRHFSGRGLFDQDRTLWGSFVVEAPAGRVYFAGDTGYGPHFMEVRKRLGPMALALLPIGCYQPRWFMRAFHMSPDDAVMAHQDLETKVSLAIHHGTFQLGDESIDAPLADLDAAKAKAGVASEAFLVLAPGAHARLAATDSPNHLAT